MKRTEQIEVKICDFCNDNEAAYSGCLGCGKDICYDCRKLHAKEYSHGVYCGGTGDGIYCLECDKRLTAEGNPLHAAYRVIGFLRDEVRGWSEDFKKRSDKAETTLKRLQSAGRDSDV